MIFNFCILSVGNIINILRSFLRLYGQFSSHYDSRVVNYDHKVLYKIDHWIINPAMLDFRRYFLQVIWIDVVWSGWLEKSDLLWASKSFKIAECYLVDSYEANFYCPVDLPVPSIVQPWVQIPNTQWMLFLKSNWCLFCHWIVKVTKITGQRKRPNFTNKIRQ